MRCLSFVIIGLILAHAAGLCLAQMPGVYSDSNLVIYDIHRNARRPFTPNQILGKSNFEPLTDTEITGDICIENRYIVLVLRKYASGPELYYKIGPQYFPAISARVATEPNDIQSPEQVCRITFADPTQVILSTEFATEAGPLITMEYLIRSQQPTVEIHTGGNAETLTLKSLAFHTIIPDLFGDDVVIDHADSRSSTMFLPEDNSLYIQLKDNGNAIFVCNWLPAETGGEIELDVSRSTRRGYDTETKIDLTGKEKVWLSMLAGVGVWHQVHTSQLNIYNQAPLNWTVPFAASWRADYRRSDPRAAGLTDSFWNTIRMPDGVFMNAPGLMEMQIVDGQYIISGPQEIKRLVRRSVFNVYIGNGWWPYLGWFMQPFYLQGNRAFMKLPRYDQLTTARYSGPVLIYPLLDDIIPDRAAITVEGVLRGALGPSYLDILDLTDLNKRPFEDYYPPTCFATEYCENIFEAFEDVPRQRHIISMLEQMKLFVKYTRARIDTYYQWQIDVEELYLDALAVSDPNLGDPNFIDAVETLDKTSSLLRKRYEREETQMKTPEHAADLADQMIDLIGNRSFAKITRAKQTGARLRNIGDTQDELLGELRDTLKIVRQRAAVLHTKETDPRVRQFLREVRRRTQTILRISYDMEGKQ